MNKVQKLINGIILLLKNPSLINLITDSDFYWKNYLKKHQNNLLQLPTANILDLIESPTELNHYTFLGGGSLPTDIILLKSLAKQIPDCSYFEIGTWRGESVINVAETAKECYTLNLSKEDILAEGLSNKYSDLHGVLSKEKGNIEHIFGNTMTYDFGALNKRFDLIFIDGNHKYNFVKNDTQKVFKHLTHKDSIVVWHDYALHPEKARYDVLAGILDGLPKDYQDNLYHVSNSLCAIYYPIGLKNKIFDFPIKPEKLFELKMQSKEV
ncbi:MAG: class I SAM-dependent methyltransferase [Flavobacterium sp.]|jgi:predicted O-methyltransferase YrrM|nr:class I SAM-dependent methyltransferase [Flavobacterium sp.]|tara:strand:- start:273 stop:1076 length:804 start_codon:yes stop_codon:yes gene_type:complete